MFKLRTHILAAINEWIILMLKMMDQNHTNSKAVFCFFRSASQNHWVSYPSPRCLCCSKKSCSVPPFLGEASSRDLRSAQLIPKPLSIFSSYSSNLWKLCQAKQVTQTEQFSTTVESLKEHSWLVQHRLLYPVYNLGRNSIYLPSLLQP